MNSLRLIVLTLGSLTLLILLVFGALLYVGENGVPFFEGDEVYREGNAYEFIIGSSKLEVLESIKLNYAKENYHISVYWRKSASYANKLGSYENTKNKIYVNDEFAEYKMGIANLEKLELLLAYENRWNIDMPTDWVNTIHLTFSNDALVEIQKSRWLFERP